MPNMWGQAHPWETAGLEHPEWLEVLRDTIRRWVSAADELHAFYSGEGGGATLERWRELKGEHDAAYEEHRRVLAGDTKTCADVEKRIRDRQRA